MVIPTFLHHISFKFIAFILNIEHTPTVFGTTYHNMRGVCQTTCPSPLWVQIPTKLAYGTSMVLTCPFVPGNNAWRDTRGLSTSVHRITKTALQIKYYHAILILSININYAWKKTLLYIVLVISLWFFFVFFFWQMYF
jgi:hypothetical protein